MGLLRILLASVVAIGHAPPGVLGMPLNASLAVSAFYVISGFYIQLVIVERYATGPGWIANFYASRLLRLFPIYWLIVAVCGVAYFAAGAYNDAFYYHDEVTRGLVAGGDPAVRNYLLFGNVAIFGQELGRFAAYDPVRHLFYLTPHPARLDWHIRVSSMWFIEQSWSVAIELWFYLIAPSLLTRRTRIVVGVALASLALRVVLMLAGFDDPEWRNAFLPSDIATFCFGALGYRFYRTRLKFAGTAHAARWRGLAALALIVAVALVYPRLAVWSRGWSYPAFVVLVAAAAPYLFRAFAALPADRLIGDLSYPVYLVHLLVIRLIEPVMATRWIAPAALVLSLAVAYTLVRWIDRPLAAFRHRRFASAPAAAAPARAA